MGASSSRPPRQADAPAAHAPAAGAAYAPPIATATNGPALSRRDPAYLLHILDQLCHDEQVIEVLIGFVDQHCIKLFTDADEEHSLRCTALHKECAPAAVCKTSGPSC